MYYLKTQALNLFLVLSTKKNNNVKTRVCRLVVHISNILISMYDRVRFIKDIMAYAVNSAKTIHSNLRQYVHDGWRVLVRNHQYEVVHMRVSYM